MSVNKYLENIKAIFLMLASVLIISGIGVLGYQIYYWFRYGEWFPMSTLYFLYDHWDWANIPTEWIGLHKVIDSTPLSLALSLLGIIVLVTTINWDDLQ